MKYQIHPLAELFPLIEGEDYEGLFLDIKKNGQLVPIVLHRGVLLDGRNRLRACEELGIAPNTVEWSGECGTPSEFILSLNFNRRQLTPDQQTVVAVRAGRFIAEEKAAKRAKETQFKTGVCPNPGGKPKPSGVHENVDPSAAPKKRKGTAAKLAKDIGVSEHKVSQALKLDKEAPELANKVISGEIKLADAVKELPSQKEPRRWEQGINELPQFERTNGGGGTDSAGLAALKRAWWKASKRSRKEFLEWIQGSKPKEASADSARTLQQAWESAPGLVQEKFMESNGLIKRPPQFKTVNPPILDAEEVNR